MRKLIAVAMLGAGAAFFAVAPAQATPASNAAGIANKIVTPDNAGVHDVRRRYKRRYRGYRHRGYRRGYRHRRYGHRRYYRPRYYYGYPGYYGHRYYRRRPGFGFYFGL